MARLGSLLATAAVAALAAVAAVDALRGGGESGPSAPTDTHAAGSSVLDPAVAETLARERISGILTYTAGCETLTLALPGLETPEGSVVIAPPCPAPGAGRLRSPVATVARDGADVLVSGTCVSAKGCPSARLTPATMRELAVRHPLPFADAGAATDVDPLDLVWLGERAALLAELRAGGGQPQPVVAVLDGERIAASWTPGPFAPAERLEASPLGTFLTLRPNVLLTRDAEPIPLPALPSLVSAIAWSPDERWTAFATRGSVWFARTAELLRLRETGRQPRLVRLPLHTEDLAWGRVGQALEPAADAELPSPLRGGVRAVAWSPDERWTVVATRASVVLVRTAELVSGRPPAPIRVPLRVDDLEWESP